MGLTRPVGSRRLFPSASAPCSFPKWRFHELATRRRQTVAARMFLDGLGPGDSGGGIDCLVCLPGFIILPTVQVFRLTAASGRKDLVRGAHSNLHHTDGSTFRSIPVTERDESERREDCNVPNSLNPPSR
jgi:hypothetical protein